MFERLFMICQAKSVINIGNTRKAGLFRKLIRVENLSIKNIIYIYYIYIYSKTYSCVYTHTARFILSVIDFYSTEISYCLANFIF